MQFRRHEDSATQFQGRQNTDLDPDGYLMMPPRSRRSLSPGRVGGPSYPHQVFGGQRRSDSSERRRVVDDGGRRIRSRSPPFMEVARGRPAYVDKALSPPQLTRRYALPDNMDINRTGVDSRMGNEFGYRHGTSRAVMDDKFEGGMHEMGGRKSAFTREIAGLGGYSVGPTSRGKEHDAYLSSESVNMGLGQLRKERGRYPDVPDSFSLGDYTEMKYYGERDENVLHPKVSPYSNFTASGSKESAGASHFKDYASTYPRNSRIDGGHGGAMPLPRDDCPRSSDNIPEPLSHSRYGQRQFSDLGRYPDLDINEDMVHHWRKTFSPPRTEHHGSLRHQPWIEESDDYIYPSDDIYEKKTLHERAGYSRRDMIRPDMTGHVTLHEENTEFARQYMSNRSSRDHHSLETPTAANICVNRPPAERREGRQYLDTVSVHSRLGRKILTEEELPYMGMVRDREFTHRGVDYDKQDLHTGYHEEMMRSSPGFLHDTERPRLAERSHKMEVDDLDLYDSSGRILKRKHTVDEEENRISSRTIMSRLDTFNRRHYQNVRRQEWVDQDARGSIVTQGRDCTHGLSRRVHRTCDGTYPTSEDWLSYRDHEELLHDCPTESYKYENKHAKGYSRLDAFHDYDSYHPNRKHVLPKWKNKWVRGEYNDVVDIHSGEVEQYEDWVSSAKPEPPEDSEEFKQSVHDFFLSFAKKLNDTPGIRKRYMEQGRAGSLFCIVCGRSVSKEFLDAQRLATHAFMSHKAGLRAQHLGLHHALCVLMGWNSTVPPGTITWSPETLSVDASLAQKEDLILWPPTIVIHNTSISNNDSDGQEPTSIEALGQFLRGKGFHGGRVKLGRPTNCSILLVKFLGTFSGLQEAEKIHQHFAKNKHGRKELEQTANRKGNSCGGNGGKGETKEGHKLDERVLFGYMGIAEDLDKVDVDTKRKCSIKSKKEIHDLMDAPVKPE